MTDSGYRSPGEPANIRGNRRLLLFGLGYTGAAIAAAANAAGFTVVATSRQPAALSPPPGVLLIPFDAAPTEFVTVTHILETAPPGDDGDPVLRQFGPDLASAPHLRWAGLLSTTGVYGDRGGRWVDEDTVPAPTGPRGVRRLEAERAWADTFRHCAVDLFRVAGIYGPGRSPFAEVRSGRARRVDKPGHEFGRIHRDDITAAVLAGMQQEGGPRVRALNLSDDQPAASAEVVAEAARLTGAPMPPLVPFAQAAAEMSPMGLSFWAENRRVASRKTQAQLGIAWRFPSYREGLRAILEQEAAERAAE